MRIKYDSRRTIRALKKNVRVTKRPYLACGLISPRIPVRSRTREVVPMESIDRSERIGDRTSAGKKECRGNNTLSVPCRVVLRLSRIIFKIVYIFFFLSGPAKAYLVFRYLRRTCCRVIAVIAQDVRTKRQKKKQYPGYVDLSHTTFNRIAGFFHMYIPCVRTWKPIDLSSRKIQTKPWTRGTKHFAPDTSVYVQYMQRILSIVATLLILLVFNMLLREKLIDLTSANVARIGFRKERTPQRRRQQFDRKFEKPYLKAFSDDNLTKK